MAISRTVQGYLSKNDFSSIEDDWLAAVSQNPEDLDYFVGVARALVGTDESERARFLLNMLDGELQERGLWALRLALLKRAGSLVLAPEELHPAILTSLKGLHADRPNYEILEEAVGLHKAIHDIPKTWDKVDRLNALVVYDVGTVVAMEKRGVGRVVELNRELDSFKVDFERFPGLMVGFRAAPKLLTPLDTDHILRRKLEDADTLKEMVKEDPPMLLRAVLRSYDRPLAAGEVKEALAGVVAPKSWTSFWNKARQHPQVLVGGKGRQSYSWAESDEAALETVWKRFDKAKPRRQIDMLRREGDRDRDLRERMAARLQARGAEAAQGDPGLAFEVWYALDRAGHAPEGVPWTPDEMIRHLTPRELFAGVEDRSLREEGYRRVRALRDDWKEVFQDLMSREEEPKALDVLAQGLREEAPTVFERFLDDLLAQPWKSPAGFYWLADRASEDAELRGRNPLRLLLHTLQYPLVDEMAPWRARFPAMVESGGTVPRLLSQLSDEQAPQAREIIRRAASLETYQRDELTNALELRFSLTDDQEDDSLYATQKSIEAKRKEFQKLVSEELPANRKAIEVAREMGDLRENFEYKSARQRHEYLSGRAAQLEGELANVQPIGAVPADVKEVRIGTVVDVDGDGGKQSITILGPWESDPDAGVLSYQSDLGRELLGRRLGDELKVSGKAYKVTGIRPWPGD
jgi:transcription elongation GreA/GreB family factor